MQAKQGETNVFEGEKLYDFSACPKRKASVLCIIGHGIFGKYSQQLRDVSSYVMWLKSSYVGPLGFNIGRKLYRELVSKMGLYAYFDVASCGLPDEITASDVGYPELEDEAETVEVDYSGALGHMVQTFMDIATTLVPIDTGYLCSTIHADTDQASYAEFFADAEYAQYVEYGTWKMGAQPYFEPALNEALEVFITEAMQALTEAQQMMQMIVQDIMAVAMEAVAGMAGESFGGFSPMGFEGMSTGTFLGGLGLGMLMMFLAFPILVNLYAILDSILGPFDPMQGRIDNLRASGIDVIIT